MCVCVYERLLFVCVCVCARLCVSSVCVCVCVCVCVAVEGSACVCVCLHESVSVLRVEQAMLASILDIVGLRLGNSQLLSPLAPSESLQAIRTSEGDAKHTSGWATTN